jgi:predicted  nucleic acid-binding Zn-ribbon protein
MATTNIEKENLEAHVELCAERYKQLENKLEQLDHRLVVVESHLLEIKDTVSNKANGFDSRLVTIGTAILGVMFTAIITLLINLVNK